MVLCETARAAGNRYTMRLLPEFLVPGCVIRLDQVEAAYEARRTGAETDRLCEILGCLDDRTVWRHVSCYGQAVEAASLRLAESRAMRPELGELPQTTPDTLPVDRLKQLWRAEQLASQRRGEVFPRSPRYLLQTALRKSRRKKTSSCVSVAVRPP